MQYYTVKEIVKMNQDVYIIYASINDSIFKIASYYNKERKKGVKLKTGSKFSSELLSQFKSVEKKFNMIPSNGLNIVFHGVSIGREPHDDIYICNELNGPYLVK